MKIGFDASRATKAIRRGPEQYSYYLLKSLAEIDHKNQYLLYSPIPPKDDLSNLPPNFSWVIMPFPRLWTQIRLSLKMLKNPPDVLFIPSHVIPIIHPKRVVVTIHDLGYKYYPKAYSPFGRFYENFSLRFLAKSTSHIITPSQKTKKDLLKFTKSNPDKISVIYHGYDQNLYNFSEKIKQGFPYIYFLGSLDEKKNIIGLILAFKILKQQEPRFKKFKLVLAGKPGYQYQKIKQLISSLPENIKSDILEPGYVDDREVASWMKKAKVFVFPSFFEGFGIPIIEAMAVGVPVVSSNIPALSEIAGGAAVLVNPKNPNEIANGIKKAVFEDKIKKDLVEKGLQRAREFSWKKCAQKTLEVLEKVGKL